MHTSFKYLCNIHLYIRMSQRVHCSIIGLQRSERERKHLNPPPQHIVVVLLYITADMKIAVLIYFAIVVPKRPYK